MTDEKPGVHDPRWGQACREEKGEAVLRTVAQFTQRNVNGGVWLDVGCGNGGMAAALAQHVDQVTAIDPEPWESWRDFCGQRSNLAFHTGSYRDLRTLVRANSVDVVLCNQVYEHVDDPLALLNEIWRIMKPGGLCYFAGPNLLWPIEQHVHWPLVHWIPRGLARRLMILLGSRQAEHLDARPWFYWSLTRAFRHVGFVAVGAIRERIRAEAEFSDSTIWRIAEYLPRPVVSMLTPLVPGFIFMLRKPEKDAALA